MKKLSLNISLYFLQLLVLSSCLEPFSPNLKESNRSFLVVDGMITDQTGPYTVRLSNSSSLDKVEAAVEGAQVRIETSDGIVETLEELIPGLYFTNTLQGVVGKSYRLLVSVNENNYESTWETIPQSAEIDSIYHKNELHAVADTDVKNELGAQFYIDSHGDASTSKYYRFEWDETWKIGVRWPAYYDYLGNDRVKRTDDPRYICWKYRSSAGINLASTSNLSSNTLANHPLLFINGRDEEFTMRYSIIVYQYTLDEREYIFWKNLEESNEQLGDLFDKQPAKVIGNMSNVSNPGDPVLGYFSASGARNQRIFVSPRDVDRSLINRPRCHNLDSLLKEDLGVEYEKEVMASIKRGNYFYDFIYSPFGGILPIGAAISRPECSDCTLKGGVLTKPYFWDE